MISLVSSFKTTKAEFPLIFLYELVIASLKVRPSFILVTIRARKTSVSVSDLKTNPFDTASFLNSLAFSIIPL